MLNSAGMGHASYNKDGSMLIFEDKKGYESDERKHERASVTRDIWAYNIATEKYAKLTSFQGNDLQPVWGDGDNYFYLSEQNDDNLNVYQSSVADTGRRIQLTHFKRKPRKRPEPLRQRHSLFYLCRRHLHP